MHRFATAVSRCVLTNVADSSIGAAVITLQKTSRSFEEAARSIMYRWAVERDTWVSTTEVAEARAFLQAIGIVTTELPDGRFALGEEESAVEASRLILVSLRHLYERRSRSPGS